MLPRRAPQQRPDRSLPFPARPDRQPRPYSSLARLAGRIDWRFLEERFGEVYEDVPGRPPLPTRLMAGLAILKHTYNLSDESLCGRWIENPNHRSIFAVKSSSSTEAPFDRSRSLTRWRQRMGEDKPDGARAGGLMATAVRTGALRPGHDSGNRKTTSSIRPSRPKAVAFPTRKPSSSTAPVSAWSASPGEARRASLRQSYARGSASAR